MGQKPCLSFSSSWQDHRVASKLGRHQDKVIPLELGVLPNLFPLESKTIIKILRIPSNQHKIRPPKQLPQQKRLHQLLRHLKFPL